VLINEQLNTFKVQKEKITWTDWYRASYQTG